MTGERQSSVALPHTRVCAICRLRRDRDTYEPYSKGPELAHDARRCGGTASSPYMYTSNDEGALTLLTFGKFATTTRTTSRIFDLYLPKLLRVRMERILKIRAIVLVRACIPWGARLDTYPKRYASPDELRPTTSESVCYHR